MRIEPTLKQTAVLQHYRHPWQTLRSSMRPSAAADLSSGQQGGDWHPGNASMLFKPEQGVWTLHEDMSQRSREENIWLWDVPPRPSAKAQLPKGYKLQQNQEKQKMDGPTRRILLKSAAAEVHMVHVPHKYSDKSGNDHLAFLKWLHVIWYRVSTKQKKRFKNYFDRYSFAITTHCKKSNK